MTVRRVRIGEVLELHRRSVAVDPAVIYQEIGVRSFGRGLFLKEPMTGADLGDKRVFTIGCGDLIVSNVFAWEGAVAVATQAHSGKVGSHRFMTWAPLDGRVDVRYINHYFASDAGRAYLQRAWPGSAGRNRTLSIKNFEAIEVPLPDLPEQRRIAAHLDKIGRALQELDRRTAWADTSMKAEQLPRLLKELLVLSDLPMVALGALCKSVNDTIHPGMSRGGADRFVGLEHVESHTGRQLGERPVGDERGRKLRFEARDVTFGYLRPYLNKAWVADGPGLCSVEQFVLRPRPGVHPQGLAHVLRSAYVLNATRAATNNLQLPRVGLATLMSIDVPDVRLAPSSALQCADQLTERFVALAQARQRRGWLFSSVLPAARNEVFSAMR